MLEDIVWLDRSDLFRRNAQLRIVRVLRRYIERRFQRWYRDGAFLDFGGKLSATLAEMTGRLRHPAPRWCRTALPGPLMPKHGMDDVRFLESRRLGLAHEFFVIGLFAPIIL